MDQRGNGRWPFHRIGQPGVQKQLRRFARSADEQQHPDKIGGVPVGPQKADIGLRQSGRCGENIIKIDAVRHEKQRENSQGKAEITNAVDHERLDRGGIGGRLFVVKPDQQVRRHADAFPTKEHLHQIVRGDQRQHREGKERKISEKAGLIRLARPPIVIMRHVAKGIQVNQCRHRIDHNQHNRCQTVQPDAPFGGQAAAFDKPHDRDVLCIPLKCQENIPA